MKTTFRVKVPFDSYEPNMNGSICRSVQKDFESINDAVKLCDRVNQIIDLSPSSSRGYYTEAQERFIDLIHKEFGEYRGGQFYGKAEVLQISEQVIL